jgi:hypothetical protein
MAVRETLNLSTVMILLLYFFSPSLFFFLRYFDIEKMNSTEIAASPNTASISQPDPEELASQIVSLLSISVLSIIMGNKTSETRFGEMSVSRILIMFLYFWSWAFTIIATILVPTNNRM